MWACLTCTLDNDELVEICEVCGDERVDLDAHDGGDEQDDADEEADHDARRTLCVLIVLKLWKYQK